MTDQPDHLEPLGAQLDMITVPDPIMPSTEAPVLIASRSGWPQINRARVAAATDGKPASDQRAEVVVTMVSSG